MNPAAPNLTGTDPASGSDNNAPKVRGSAPAGTTVRIYSSPNCSGAPAATGSSAQLAGSGIPVSVADNSTTTFRATATKGGGTSSCSSSSVTYVESTLPGVVSFSKHPPKKTKKRKARFGFTAPNAASYECSLDRRSFKPCSSPVKLERLKRSRHSFRVRGIGGGGRTGPTTTFTWKVKRK